MKCHSYMMGSCSQLCHLVIQLPVAYLRRGRRRLRGSGGRGREGRRGSGCMVRSCDGGPMPTSAASARTPLRMGMGREGPVPREEPTSTRPSCSGAALRQDTPPSPAAHARILPQPKEAHLHPAFKGLAHPVLRYLYSSCKRGIKPDPGKRV